MNRIFRARHQRIQAERYDGSDASIERIRRLFPDTGFTGPAGVGDSLFIELKNGVQEARPGDWIARNGQGRLKVISEAEFEEEYEPIVPHPA